MKLKMVLRNVALTSVLVVYGMLGLTACGDMDVSGANLEREEGKQEIKKNNNENKSVEHDLEQNTKEEEIEKVSNEEKAKKSNIVSYEYKDKDIFMSIELPSEWEYKIHTVEELEKQDGLKLCSIEFWLKEKPELKLEFAYWPMIGLCGTGLTTEEVTFENGLSAEKNTEEMEESVWLMLIYKLARKEGHFAVDADINKKLWKEYEEDIMKVLGTASFIDLEK